MFRFSPKAVNVETHGCSVLSQVVLVCARTSAFTTYSGFCGAQFSPAGVMYPEVAILHSAAMIGNKGTNPHLDPQRFCTGEHCLILLWNCCGVYDHGGANFASGMEKNKSEPHCLLHGGTFTLDMH